MLGFWVTKLLVLCVAVWVLCLEPPVPIKSFVMVVALYALLSFLMDGPGAIITVLIGLKVSPHFDRPWLATSITSFWSERWDLAAGNMLRTLVFEPICEGRLVYDETKAHTSGRPKPLRATLAITLTYAASGLAHEYIFWCLTGHTTGGVWMCFFLSQVPLQMGERVVLRWLKKRGVQLPTWLRIAYVWVVGTAVGWLFFWRPVVSDGVMDDAITSVKGTLTVLAGVLGLELPAILALP